MARKDCVCVCEEACLKTGYQVFEPIRPSPLHPVRKDRSHMTFLGYESLSPRIGLSLSLALFFSAVYLRLPRAAALVLIPAFFPVCPRSCFHLCCSFSLSPPFHPPHPSLSPFSLLDRLIPDVTKFFPFSLPLPPCPSFPPPRFFQL